MQPRRTGIKRKQVKKAIRQLLVHLMLIPLAVVFMLPFLWMLSTSRKPDTQFYLSARFGFRIRCGGQALPGCGYLHIVFLYLRNTLTIAVLATIGS